MKMRIVRKPVRVVRTVRTTTRVTVTVRVRKLG